MRHAPYVCGFDAAMDVVGGKWKGLILWELRGGPRRFGQLRRALTAVSEKILAQQLREMEADELLTRHAFDEVPPRVEYALTDIGRSLLGALSPLGDWGVDRMRRLGLPYSAESVA